MTQYFCDLVLHHIIGICGAQNSKKEMFKQIEAQVKDPSFSLDGIEPLLKESARLVQECKDYTRGLREMLSGDDNLS